MGSTSKQSNRQRRPLRRRSAVRRVALATTCLAATLLSVAAPTAQSAAQPAPAAYQDELGPNIFGADALGVPEPVPVEDAAFETGAPAWERVAEEPATVEIQSGAGRDGTGGAVVTVPSSAPVAWPNVGQRMAAPPTRTLLRLTTWVRTSEVADGYGAYLAIDYHDATGARITWSQSGSVQGTQDWGRLELLGEVPAGTTTIAIRLLLNGHGQAAFDHVTLEAYAALDEPAHAVQVRLRETEEVLNRGVEGVGVENNVYAFVPGVLTREQRRVVDERLAALRPAWVRVFTDTSWWSTAEGYDFSGPMVQALLADLRRYDSLGARANLVMWRPLDWDPPRYGEMADAMVALLRWLRSQGVGNIAALTLYNEPNGEFPGLPAEYVEMYQIMATALRQADLDDVVLVAGDTSQGGDAFFDAVVPPLRGLAGWSSYHEYVDYRASLTIPTLHVQNRVQAAQDAGVSQLFLWESNLTGGVGAGTFSPGSHNGVLLPARYPVALKLAAYHLQALAGGVKGVSYWEAFDMRYGGPDASLMSFGMWSAAEDGLRLRPTYYSVQLLSRFIRPGASITRLAAEPDRAVLAYGVRNRDGSRLVYVVNPWESAVEVEVELTDAGSTALRYQLDEQSATEAIAQQRPVLQPQPRYLPDGHQITDVVPPESLVLYRLPANGDAVLDGP
jgi:hypothetical protein